MLAHGFEDVGECPPGASGHERADGLGHAERVDGPLPRCFLVSELEVELGLLDVQNPTSTLGACTPRRLSARSRCRRAAGALARSRRIEAASWCARASWNVSSVASSRAIARRT